MANVGEYVVVGVGVGVGDGAYVVYAVVLVVYGVVYGGDIYGEGEVKVKRMVVGWPPMVVVKRIT